MRVSCAQVKHFDGKLNPTPDAHSWLSPLSPDDEKSTDDTSIHISIWICLKYHKIYFELFTSAFERLLRSISMVGRH